MTGAEIVGGCQEAKMHWMRELLLKQTEEPERSGNDGRGDDEFLQQHYIVNALASIKPLLSNPEALEEFRVFENRDQKKILV